jgi:hypothetical protein
MCREHFGAPSGLIGVIELAVSLADATSDVEVDQRMH